MRYHDRYSGKNRFVQDGSYSPKTKNQSKADWRRRKGFQRDQAKSEAFCNCGRYLKEIGNRCNRRWVKQMIHHGKYDQIYWHQDMFVSSWDAC